MRHLYFLVFLIVIVACSGSGNKQEKKNEEPFQYLYDKVMSIHDEVMPRMDEIQKIKRQLQEKLKNSKDLAEEKRKELEQKIALLDSASRAMMNWMHEYNPEYYEGDSLRIYLENEVERVTRVKELMLDAIKKGSEDGQ